MAFIPLRRADAPLVALGADLMAPVPAAPDDGRPCDDLVAATVPGP